MNKFIIATHSTYAHGLYNCLKFFKNDIDNVFYINAYVDDMEFEKSFISLIEKIGNDNLTVLTDMPGGSVNQVCTKLLPVYKYHLISGVNFPLVLELIFQTDILTDNTIRNIIENAKQQLMYINDMVTIEDRDDEDL